MAQLHYFRLHFDQIFEIEVLEQPRVQLIGNRIQMLLAVDRQVCAREQVPADQPVDDLVAAALPGAVRIAEVDRSPSLLGGLGVLKHFLSLVVGHALAHCQQRSLQRRAEVLHRRGIALGQAALPATGYQMAFALKGMYVADHVEEQLTLSFALSQENDQFPAKLANG